MLGVITVLVFAALVGLFINPAAAIVFVIGAALYVFH